MSQFLAGSLYRAGRRMYALRADGTVATIQRKGFVHVRYEIRIGGQCLNARLRWNGELEVVDDAGSQIGHTDNLARRRVAVRLRDRPPLIFARSSSGRQWSVSPWDGTSTLRFAPHPRWQGRPVVTISADGPVGVTADTLLLTVIGTCLVLAYRHLTAGLVRGSSPAWRVGPTARTS